MSAASGLGRLEGQSCDLDGHILRIGLIHGVAGQTHSRDAGHCLPVPVNDRIQMIEDRIPA